MASTQTYTVRFGIEMLMAHFLDENFLPEYPAWAAELRSEEYYVNMMITWYFATALCKQWDAVISFLRENRLGKWTHNKAMHCRCDQTKNQVAVSALGPLYRTLM